MNRSLPRRLAALATAGATGIVLVALAILPFLTPPWVAFEQDRARSAEWTGYAPAELRAATDAILHDLVWGPPDFDATDADGRAVLGERERAHMRDVRGVFGGFGLLALAALAWLAASWAGARRLGHAGRWWSAVRAGAWTLAGGVVVAGVAALVAFDAAFEAFHRLFFAGGSYTFDPASERLVQLFPFAFWSETTIAVGAVIVGLAVATGLLAGRRAAGVAGAPGVHAVTAPEPVREAAR